MEQEIKTAVVDKTALIWKTEEEKYLAKYLPEIIN